MIFRKFDVVKVEKQTRGKFNKKAKPGETYLVTSIYESHYGTIKLFLIDEECNQFGTTSTCATKLYNVDDLSKKKDNSFWAKVKKKWMDKTYVPIIVNHFYGTNGMPIITSRDSSAALVSDIRNTKQSQGKDGAFWLNSSLVHDDDVEMFLTSSLIPDVNKKGEPSNAIAVRVPVWFAKKKGIFG